MIIYNEDCISGAKEHIPSQCVDLMICDPPFGINEASFDKHYKRSKEKIIDGYVEAPDDYRKFSFEWMTEAKRVLKDTGSMYVISGHSKLLDILLVAETLNLYLINHLIWKYSFGVSTKKKYTTSHYHVLYFKKNEDADVTFNLYCRYGHNDLDHGNKMYSADIESVWEINKEYHQGNDGVKVNANKLPEELVKKMILYSSNKDDMVCDFLWVILQLRLLRENLVAMSLALRKITVVFLIMWIG